MKVPQPFPSKRTGEPTNKFYEAKGQPDGIVLGRDNTGTPFGQPFGYTDADDLPGDFKKAGATQTLRRGAAKALKSKKLFGAKKPIAWAAVEPSLAEADMAPPNEVRVSPIDPADITPVYDERLITCMDEYERLMERERGGKG